MQCTATSDYYRGFTGRRDLRSLEGLIGRRPRSAFRVESTSTPPDRAARR